MSKKYIFDDIIEARNEERDRVRIIVEYLLNKNSYPDRVDYETFFDDMQDFERSLIE